MAKKLIIVWLFTLTILVFSSISVYADDDVRGDFFIKNVIINGERIVNYNLKYSVLLYDDTMYIPLTPEMCEIYGVTAEMNWESRTLKLLKEKPTRKNIAENWLKNDAGLIDVQVIPDAKALAYVEEVTDYIYDRVDIALPEMTIEEIDLKGMPLLESDKNVYIPLRAISESEIFNWDVYFSNYFGVCISTDNQIPAVTYFDSKEALENKGLVNYIRSCNPSVTPSYGQQLVFLFKRAGEVYGTDPKLLMAIAHKESTFNAGAVSRSGAVGMMQIMPATGAMYGFTTQQLLAPKTSIDFGARYISERIDAYDGNWVLGLSAYNQGSRSVNRGTHSNVYANKVMTAYSGIDVYLTTNGYGV